MKLEIHIRCRITFTLIAATMVAVVLSTGFSSASEANAGPYPRVLARAKLNASRGGRVRAGNGVELRVPGGAMRRGGVARITEVAEGEYAIHIAAPWRGAVTVSLPTVDGLPIVAHRVLGKWRIESARIVDGRAVARVRHLSLFGDLAKCIKPESFSGLLACLIKAGVRQIPHSIFKTIVEKIIPPYDPCRPINFSLDITDLFAACPAVDGPPPHTQSAPQTHPQSQPTPPASHPQPQPPTPIVSTYHVHGTCSDGACGLKIRAGPGYSSYSAIGSLVEGEAVQIACQTLGETVGPSPATGISSAIWDHLAAGGWVSDVYIDTPNAGTWSPPLPQC